MWNTEKMGMAWSLGTAALVLLAWPFCQTFFVNSRIVLTESDWGWNQPFSTFFMNMRSGLLLGYMYLILGHKIIGHYRSKHGDNMFGSVLPFVCLSFLTFGLTVIIVFWGQAELWLTATKGPRSANLGVNRTWSTWHKWDFIIMKQLDVVVSPPAFVWDPNLTLTHVTFDLDSCDIWPLDQMSKKLFQNFRLICKEIVIFF